MPSFGTKIGYDQCDSRYDSRHNLRYKNGDLMKAESMNTMGLKLTMLAAFVSIAALSGCNKNGQNGNPIVATIGGQPNGANGEIFATIPGPIAGTCLQPGTAPVEADDFSRVTDDRRPRPEHLSEQRRFRLRGYAWEPGFQAGAFPNSGLCGCVGGTYPACGPQGLTCIPTGGFGGAQVATWGFQNGQFVGNGFSNGFAGNGTCANTVAQICTPGQTAPGVICQPIAEGSPYGAWVQQL